ncbi:hypothetical protein M947_07885 [Sulfurimonas hongkongensis]|uniref:Uncharacterized protein n=1 Tax=Sulfurimonas hongkongensis TaxID=1172190 RepID=T0JQF1_9BACT|nr:glycosyltransferase [Sulfurimonas hongkongensis]EQB39072.1 hypothetical protein M947_07885 [Sulfurimonas hongkongensis]
MMQESDLKIDLAPIVLFVYSRKEHTKEMVEALQKNEFAKESELFIYSDAAKNEDVTIKVDAVREYLKTIDGFKKVSIIEREKNWGLAENIIDGVTKIVNKYGKIIVLEDDLVTSPYFLKFMNEALKFYMNEKKVWHVSGWNYPIQADGLGDVFLWRVMNCWGWATWVNRWEFFEKDIKKTISKFTQDEITRFNLEGIKNFWDQVVSNQDGKLDTWAIFWYATIFKQNGLCLNPSQTFVKNIGHDGSGVNCDEDCSFTSALSMNNQVDFSTKVEENHTAVEMIKEFFISQKKPFAIRVINKLSRIFTGKNIIK